MSDQEQVEKKDPEVPQQDNKAQEQPAADNKEVAASAASAAADKKGDKEKDPDAPDGEFDCIVLGTGLTECVLSGLLATHGMKVLHIDRNAYYGGECASLNLEQQYAAHNRKPRTDLGPNHKYCIDQIPKVLMCAGEIVKILRTTVVERYSMEFMLIESSHVMQNKKVQKVPVTPSEALSSDLMGFFEKRRCGNFLQFVAEYSEEAELQKIAQKKKGYDLRSMPAAAIFKEFGLEENTITFLGHAAALYTTDDYLQLPAYDMVMRCKLYYDSLMMYGSSPYVYPLYGSGELPQAFSRLCAVYGGTYMLQTPVHKINYDDAGVFQNISYGNGWTAKAKYVVGDASYFPDRSRKTGQVVRCIALLNHPINTGAKEPSKSLQIIIPYKEANRRHDVFVLQLSSENQVCPPGFFIAIVGTVVENPGNPAADLEAGLRLLGPTLETFVKTTDLFVPVDDGAKSRVFVTDSYDAETHFEKAGHNVLDLFRRIYGRPYDFEKAKAANDAGTTVKQ
jgi:Rab GDP dissociation inhibitor